MLCLILCLGVFVSSCYFGFGGLGVWLVSFEIVGGFVF